MNERERILELVKQGVLSTEEGLDLLENLAKKEDKQTEEKEFASESKQSKTVIKQPEPAQEPKSSKAPKRSSFAEEIKRELADARKELSGAGDEIRRELSSAKKQFNKEINREFGSDEDTIEEDLEELNEEIESISEEVENETDEKIKSDLEKELENIANEINRYSTELDQVNDQISDLKTTLLTKEEDLTALKEDKEAAKKEKIAELTQEVKDLQDELELVRRVDEVDNEAEIKQLKDEVSAAEAELRETEEKPADAFIDSESIEEIKEEKLALKKELAALKEEKAEIMRQLHQTKMKQWTTKAKQVSDKLEIPEEWKKDADDALKSAGKHVESTRHDLGHFVRETIKNARGALDNVELKDMNVRVPGVATEEFEHEWLFEESSASILDFKNANGNIKFEKSINNNIKISAKIKLYGKMEEPTAMEKFEARTTIEHDEDKLTFHIPNKRIKADMIVYLPERSYDYLAVNILNGNVTFDSLQAKDVYIKTTNGNVTFKELDATMLETKGTNGNLKITNGKLRDMLSSLVNGNIRYVGEVQSSDVTTVNGNVKLTLHEGVYTRLQASTMNGNVKIALPKNVDIDGEVKTKFGKISSRLSETEEEAQSKKKNHYTIKRLRGGDAVQLSAKAHSGNVLLKDTDQV